ncbi:related to NUP49-nuclear pore protein [Sporisorium reilianum SRZ2]|uniref:Related to NUP49-nuclear pore protein n=1 Tax=Sporisorium reilianum (strain SRZ2) TaxID=999809 RepID=E6ZUB7_SPORE|nr:related to NUP49-nuclear pore protein [Sporisorium reilianum SRZ2]
MFGSTPAAPTTGSTLGRSASFSFSQPPAHKPFSGSSGGFSFGGGAAAATSTAASSTGAAAPAAGGFSFGAKPATTTAAPAAGGGLFGSSTTTQPQQQQQPPQSGFGGGLFGASNNTAASTSTGGGLFGKPAAAPAAGGFSFGSSSNNAASSSAGGLFGSSTQPAQQQQQQQQPSTSLFSFGSSQPQQQQQQQQQQQNNTFQPFQLQPQFNQAAAAAASPFARHGYFQKERFNELPDDARKLVEELETHISAQTQLRDELKTKNFGDEIRKCAAEWHELDAALKSLSATLDTDENQTLDVGRLLERDRTTTSTLYSIVVNAKEPRAPGASDGTSFVEWLERFFGQLAVEHRDRIARYAATVETIQHHLASLSSRDTYTPQAISDAIHAQHESFMTLAAQVAALHAEVEALKKDYARWYKQVHKSVRDPFGSMNALAGSVPPAS